MRSIRFERFGEPADVLQLAELPVPEPRAGQALVHLRARPINPSDLMTIRGTYGLRPMLPATPGYEGMGVVERLGPNTAGVAIGLRVIPLGARGTWQEYVSVDESQLLPVPDTVSDATAAQFVVNPLTAWVMLTEELNVQPDQWLLQTAAGSTLGRMVLQIAKIRGFKTINVVRRRAQVEELKALGAEEVIATEDEDMVERVKAITKGAGVLAAIDAVAGKTGGEVVRSLGRKGVVLVYGLLSGKPIPVDPGYLLMRCATVRGFWLAEWFQSAPKERQQGAAAELVALMAAGKILPPVEAEYDLADFGAAVRHAETPGRHGKVLLTG